MLLGYVSWIGKYADKNAVLVDILYDCGAVPFVRTNVPQTLMVRINVTRYTVRIIINSHIVLVG